MENKLFVGNLAWAVTEEDLSQLFSQFGTVENVEVLRDKFTNRARGFAFLTMATDAEAQNAVNNLEGKDFMGRPLKVNVARPREEGAPRRSFGGDRGGFGGGERRSFGGDRGGFGGGRGGFGGGDRGGFGGGERRSFGGDRGGFGGGDRGGFGGGNRGGFGGGDRGGFGGNGGGEGGYRFKPRPRRDFGSND